MSKLKTALKIGGTAALAGLVIAGGLAATTVASWVDSAPVITKQTLKSDSSSRMYDSEGHIIWQSSQMKRNYVKYSDMPKEYVDALVSVENRSFFKDSGVSMKSVISAGVGNLLSHSSEQRGGSTITQQLIKLTVYGTGKQYQTYKRKVQEMYLASNLSKSFSKKEILEFYVNKLYEGHSIYGAQTIANYYYGKDLKDLNLSQQAYIAGIGQSPTVFDLYGTEKQVAYSRERRDEVLSAMLDNKKISRKQFKEAKKTDIKDGLLSQGQKINEAEEATKKDQAYVSSALLQVRALGYDPDRDGLEIHTGLNQKMQDIVLDRLNNSEAYRGMDGVQAAVTITAPSSGNVLAQVGGRNTDTLFGLNRATQTGRSTGSGIKPLIDYGPAIEYLNWPTNKLLSDTPYTYAGTNINLYDFDRGFLGNIPMKSALTMSRNIPAARALDAVGGSRAAAFLDKMNLPNKGDKTGGSDAVGIDASTSQMAAAYGAVANGGRFNRAKYVLSVVTPDGKTHQTPNQTKQAMSPGTAYSLISMMKDVFKPGQTGQKAIISDLAQAGKTGTVGYDASLGLPDGAVSDSWVNGFVKGASISMWTGYDQPNKDYIPAALELNDQIVYREIMEQIRGMVDTSDWVPTGVVDLGNGYFKKVDTTGAGSTGSVKVDSEYSGSNQVIDNLFKAEKQSKNKKRKAGSLNAKQVKTSDWIVPDVPSYDDVLKQAGGLATDDSTK